MTFVDVYGNDHSPWADILQQVGYEAISGEDLRAVYSAWQGVLHRPDRASQFLGGSAAVEIHTHRSWDACAITFPPPQNASPLEQAAFWLGVLFMVGCYAITIPLIAFLASRVERGPAKG